MFENRKHAGELLGVKLKLDLKKEQADLVLGITRGGVVVAAEVAKALNLPLDAIVIKKLGSPHNPELAIGAIGPDNSTYLDKSLISVLNLSKDDLWPIIVEKEDERFNQELLFRGKREPSIVKGKKVILVDDGVATGATAFCAGKYLRQQKAKAVILAIPVVAEGMLDELNEYFNTVIALRVEREFHAVGEFYKEFPQVTDDEVVKVLRD